MEERDDIRNTEAEDRKVESAVLQHVLALHPAILSRDEIALELAGEDADFAERDAVERAVGDLVKAGLLHVSDSLVMPSQAALRFDRLLGE